METSPGPDPEPKQTEKLVKLKRRTIRYTGIQNNPAQITNGQTTPIDKVAHHTH
jgi:hypothetical protein